MKYLTVQMMAGSSLFYLKFVWHMLCLCHYGPALLRFWFQTDLGRENSASFLKIQAGKTFSYHGHALVTLYVQFLCSNWSKFDRWVHAEIYAASWNLFNLATEADRVLCQFVMFLSKVSFSTGCTKWNIAALKSLLLFIHHNNKDFKPRVLFLEEKGVRLISLSFL